MEIDIADKKEAKTGEAFSNFLNISQLYHLRLTCRSGGNMKQKFHITQFALFSIKDFEVAKFVSE